MEQVWQDRIETSEAIANAYAEPAPEGPQFGIEATMAPRFGFATHQNAVPVLRHLSVRNLSSTTVRRLVVELFADPPVLSPRIWHIDSIAAGETAFIADRDLTLNAEFLFGLAEAVTGRVVITLHKVKTGEGPDETLAEKKWPLRISPLRRMTTGERAGASPARSRGTSAECSRAAGLDSLAQVRQTGCGSRA